MFGRQKPSLGDACQSGEMATLLNLLFLGLIICFCPTTVPNILIIL